MMRAGPCRSGGAGSGIGRRIVYAAGSAGPSSAPMSSADCCSRRVEVKASAPSPLPATFSPPPPDDYATSEPIGDSRSAAVRAPLAARKVRADARLYATTRAGSGTRPACRLPAWLSAPPGPRMGRDVHLTESLYRDQGIDLGGGHRSVTQQLLHHSHIRAAVEQVGGVRVAQR